jgi:phasin family protein
MREMAMAESKMPIQDMSAMTAQSIDQARGAMQSYLQFFERSMITTPWVGTALNQKVMKYAEQNIATAFGYAQKLTQAKDLQEVARLQTEFFQAQLKLLTEQAKDLSETATKATAGAMKVASKSSS